MTPAERRLLAAFERQAADARPELRAALVRLFAALRAALTDAELERLLRTTDVEGIVALVQDAFTESRVQPVREAIRTAYRRAAERQLFALPPTVPRTLRVDAAFDVLSPRVLEAIRTLESRALTALTEDAAATVRQVVTRGLVDGVGPRALIPELRGAIGLGPTQEQAVANFRAALASGDFAKARGYALRDQRFSLALPKGTALPPERIDRMVDAYRKKYLALNAETQARTAALDAVRAGQRAAWDATLEQGDIDRRRLLKKWRTTLDGRERPEHHAMDGVEIPFDEHFAVDGGVLVPGQNTYNCRCALTYRLARAA